MRNLTKIILLTVTMVSCVSGASRIEFFFMGEGVMQYFFPALTWTETREKCKLEADWLYRNYALPDQEGGARTVLNFTIRSDDRTFRQIPAGVLLKNNQETITIPDKQITILYIDRGKTRYSAWLYSEKMQSFMAGAEQEATISVLWGDGELNFHSPSAFGAQVSYFREVILGI